MSNEKKSSKRGKKTSDKEKFDGRNRGSAKDSRVGADDRNRSRNNATNGPEWYYPNAEIRDSYANLPLNALPGIARPASTLSGVKMYGTQFTLPGIMSIKLHEAVGIGQTFTDPINQAGFNLWQHVRTAMSGGSLPVDMADIMMEVLGVRSIYAWVSELIKVYGLLTLYSWENYLIPEALIISEGFDLNNLVLNKPQFYAYLVETINKVNRFYLPSEMTIFNRTVSLSQACYFDSTTQRSQIYDFVWDNHYQYTWTSANGTTLTDLWANGRPTGMTFADIVLYTDTLVNSMYTNEDVGTITGYMAKAFPNKRITLAIPPADYVTPFVFSEEILCEIQNMKCYGHVVDTTITQDPSINGGLITCEYVLTNAAGTGLGTGDWLTEFAKIFGANETYDNHAPAIWDAIPAETLFVFHKNDVSEDDWAIASRLAPAITGDTQGRIVMYPGSEYVVDWEIVVIDQDAAGVLQTEIAHPRFTYSRTSLSATALNTRIFEFGAMSSFRYAPEWRVFNPNTGGTAIMRSAISFMENDVDSLISTYDLQNLQRMALLGMFRIADMT